MITPNEYQALAMMKEADQEKIRQRVYDLGIKATRLDNAARGLADEVGEVNGAVKKYLEYGGSEPDRTNIIEEAGDVLWRTSQLLLAVGATMEEAMVANLRKLNVRYERGYSDEQAANRNTDAEAEAMNIVISGTGVYSDPESPEAMAERRRKQMLSSPVKPGTVDMSKIGQPKPMDLPEQRDSSSIQPEPRRYPNVEDGR